MAEIKNKTLWMRPVEWEIILKLLEIVYRENGKLRPIELENIALEEGAFKSKTTAQLAHSPRFYYRKALEHLGLVNSVSGRYSISNNPAVLGLISNGTEIDPCKKQTLAELIVANEDCREQFISLFALNGVFNLGALKKKSTYVIAKSYTVEKKSTSAKRSLKPIMLTSPVLNRTILADTPDRIHAIFWGIRRWLLDLDEIDEIITSPKKGRLIYFVNPVVDERLLTKCFYQFLSQHLNSNSKWFKVYIPDFYEYVISHDQLRASTLFIKRFLINFVNENKSLIIPIPISGTMLNAEVKFEKQDTAFKRSFLKFRDLGYVAHLHIHESLIKGDYA